VWRENGWRSGTAPGLAGGMDLERFDPAADAGAARPVPLTQPAVPPAAKEAAPKPKGRVPSLIERVTGVGRARAPAPEPPPRPAVQAGKPASQPNAQPRLAPLEPDDRPNLSREDDLLDIPAFLRRQAN